MHVRHTCNCLVLPNAVDSAGHAQITTAMIAVIGDVEVAIPIHDHGRIMAFVLGGVGDGLVDP